MRIAVIGAGGQIGHRLVRVLSEQGQQVTAIARRPPAETLAAGVDWRTADAADVDELARALAGCEVAVATLGLPYDITAWETQWPGLTRSVTAALAATCGRLVWLDNCYAYGHSSGPISEDQPLRPASRMGAARARGAAILAQAEDAGLQVAVGRAADFIGRGVDTSVLTWRALNDARRTGRLSWLGDPRTRHSYARADEVAAALAALALRASATGTWHLPALLPTTGDQLCAALADLAGRRVRPAALPGWALRLAGPFSAMARAAADMAYLTTEDFVLDDNRFRRAFDWPPPLSPRQALQWEFGQAS